MNRRHPYRGNDPIGGMVGGLAAAVVQTWLNLAIAPMR